MSSQESFKKRRGSLLNPIDQDRRTGFVFLIISVVAHGLFFGGLIFFQDFHFARSMPPVVQIDLVSFSPILGSDKAGSGGGKEVKEDKEEKKGKKESQEIEEAGTPIRPPETKTEEPPPVIKPDISLKAKPKNLKDLLAEQEKKIKEEEKKKEEKIDKKIPPKEAEVSKTMAKPDGKQDENNMSEVLTRLRKKVAEQGKLKRGQGGEGEGEGEGKGIGKGGTPGGSGKGGATPEQQYLLGIVSRIQENWVFNENLARMDRNLEVRILIKILRSGEIRDIIFETRSGNSYLDESAKKAIMKINPLPPLPDGGYSYDLLLGFTPQGLK